MNPYQVISEAEGINRYHSRWSKSRTPALTHNPNLGPLSSMHITFPPHSQPLVRPQNRPSARTTAILSPTLLSVSESLGSAVQSIPFTGKLARGTLLATPVDNLGRPFGFQPIQVTSSVISPDGTRILFGMADGSLRFVSCGATGRGIVAGIGDRGEVRSIEDAHRNGTDVVALTFGRPGSRSRNDVFVSVGQDGMIHVWQLNLGASARDRPAPAMKIWSSRVELSTRVTLPPDMRVGAAAPPTVSALAFDPGWSGRSGRKAVIAVGLSTGITLCWTNIDLELGNTSSVDTSFYHQLASPSGSSSAIDTLHLDHVPAKDAHRLLVHAKDDTSFARWALDDSKPVSMTFQHAFKHLGSLTAFAIDFEEPPASLLGTSTPKEGRITGFTPNDPSTPVNEELPTSSSKASLASLADSRCSLFDTMHGSAVPTTVNAFGRRKFVVAGDAQGRIHIWDWDADQLEDQNATVEPQKTLITSESRITALELTEAIFFVGSLDGTVQCFDALTFTLLRTFKNRTAPRMPARMLAAGQFDETDEGRWKVSHIRASRDAIVVAIGNRILAWRISSDLGKKKLLKGVAGAGGKMSARTERFRTGMELRSEIKESIDSLSTESADRVQRLEREHRINSDYGLPPSLDNMTEEEAVALALMLSAEEEEARWFSDSGRSSNATSPAFEPVPEDLLDMEGLSLDGSEGYERPSRAFGNRRPSSSLAYEFEDWDDDDDEAASDRAPSIGTARSVSLSIPTSPTLRGSSLSNGSPSPTSSRSIPFTWRPSASLSPGHASPSFSHTYSSSSNNKVQLSPCLGPTYGSAGVGSNHASPSVVPDMNLELWPTATSPSTSSSFAKQNSSPNNRISALVSPAPSQPAMKRGWNVVAASSPSPTSSSPSSSHSTNGTTSPSPWSTPSKLTTNGRSSLLTEQLRSQDGNDHALERVLQLSREDELRKREEDELRFAIELSLAEEASKK